MSERKVLNKYYPPDYDPSKIPRCKEARNKTFIIRLMAPCNMRCTTCGEYIYKGRKFNSRKEDVDDMNHLGLRIYRFYIKCTACLSEISFRTDPANTDYILEAGATRNFEALAKAEKAAEQVQKAYEEELKTNPMKLLEERTEQSKNEMDRLEALEELQQQNKREIKIDYEGMLQKYDKIREEEIKKQEEEDEEYVKSLFGKVGPGSSADGASGSGSSNGQQKIKRILDEDESDSDDDAKKRITKKIKTEKVTDFLSTEQTKKPEALKPWEKSVGSLGAKKKGGLGILVKKKSPVASTNPAPVVNTGESAPKKEAVKTEAKKIDQVKTEEVKKENQSKSEESDSRKPAPAPKPNSLSLLAGDYSDSSEGDDD